MMVHSCARFVQEDRVGPRLAQPYAEFGFFVSARPKSHVAKLTPETAYRREDRTAQGHILADQVAHGSTTERQSAITAADHPAELLRKPVGRRTRPARLDVASDARDPRLGVRLRKLFEPVRFGRGIII